MRWKFWSGRRDRLVLTLVGVLVLSLGLSAMSAVTDSLTGTVVRTFEKTWRTPYDILVHVPLNGAASLPDVMEPNVLSTLPAGISKADLENIRSLADVKVAAPVAPMGYVTFGPSVEWPLTPADGGTPAGPPVPGLYRAVLTAHSNQSPFPEQATYSFTWAQPDGHGQVPTGTPEGALRLGSKYIPDKQVTGLGLSVSVPMLVVGIDPDSEAQLVGVDKAITDGRYFLPTDRVGVEKTNETSYTLPVLVNPRAFAAVRYDYRVEKLDGTQHVEQVVYQHNWEWADMAQFASVSRQLEQVYSPLSGTAGQLQYRTVTSPFPQRWPSAVELLHVSSDELGYVKSINMMGNELETYVADLGPTFRSWQSAQQGANRTALKFRAIGAFDATRLAVSKDPDSQLPLATYRPAEALQVLNARNQAVNPPQLVRGGITASGFLTSPPVLLTTLDAVLQVKGDRAISAVQVKVAGDTHFTPENVARVRSVAKEIERRTGLIAEVIMGSSPEQVLVHVPTSNGRPDFGWVQEQWSHKNLGVAIVQQVAFGYSGFIVLMLVVALLSTVATASAGVSARRRELGIATAIGWPRRSLQGIAVMEQVALAGAAGILAAASAAYAHVPLAKIALIFATGLLIYVPAMLAVSYSVSQVSPGDALRFGDTAPGRRLLPGAGLLSLSLASLMGRPARSFLTVLATALPTALLLVLVFVSRKLSGTLYTTLAGQYTMLQVTPMQYVMGMIALGTAVVTAFDLIRQNAVDHRHERALLHALGWPRHWVASTMVAEGGFLGIAAGVLGVGLGLSALAVLYGPGIGPALNVALWILLLPLMLGLLTGAVSSLLELRSWDRATLAGVGQSQVVGRRTVVAGAAILVVVVAVTVIAVLPQLSEQAATARIEQAHLQEQASADQAVAAVKTAVADQSAFLERGDATAFMATLDPSAPSEYRAEQQHWLEDAAEWRREYPQGRLSRTVSHIALLGDNTARITMEQRIAPNATSAQSFTLSSIWVWTKDFGWREHGPDQAVLSENGVSVWYPDYRGEEHARLLLNSLQTKRQQFQQVLGWNVATPIVVQELPDDVSLRATIGPNLIPLPGSVNGWYEVGEPLRMADQGDFINYDLALKAVTDQSHNHVSEWFRHGLVIYAVQRLNGVSILAQSQVAEARKDGPMAPEALPNVHLIKATLDQAVAWHDASTLFVYYLQERFGPATADHVLKLLAERPVDTRMTGPSTYAGRSEETISALERTTGKTWAELNRDYLSWLSGQP